MTISCFAAKQTKERLVPFEYDPDKLGPWDIEVSITHCGICYSDIHLINNDWGTSTYPLVPGHEIIGKVTAVGENVRSLKKGHRVGIGWQRSSCLSCEWCTQGEENLCFRQEATCVGHKGGFAKSIITDSRFAFPIPDVLESENAAPLLCGGATVFSPLIKHNITATKRVGVIGIGGLGHLALQFAHAFGCEVTAFSSSPDKEQEAKRFGANHFISSTDNKAMQQARNTLDFIISTVNVALDWPGYLNILRPKGTLCFVGAVEKEISVAFGSLLSGRKSISASNIASRHEINDMLRFAAQHGIKAQTELFPMNDVNIALDKLRKNDVRYRAVLVN